MTADDARALRESLGLTVQAWARIVGMNPRAINNVESGNRKLGKAAVRLWTLLAKEHQKKAHRKENRQKETLTSSSLMSIL